MIKLNNNPTEGSALKLSLSFRDAMGNFYVPVSVKYTLLALDSDEETWSIVDDIYKKSIAPASSINLMIPEMKLIEGTTLRRKLIIDYEAFLDNEYTDFIDEVEFSVQPMPYISNLPPVPPVTVPPSIEVVDITLQIGSLINAPISPVFLAKTNIPLDISSGHVYIVDDTGREYECSLTTDMTNTNITIAPDMELRNSVSYRLIMESMSSPNGEYSLEYYELSFRTVSEEHPIQEEKTVTINRNGTTEVLPDEGYSAIAKTIVNTDVALEEKSLTISENTTMEIEPSEGYDGFEKITLTVAIPTQNSKSVTVTGNGVTEVTPDEGYDVLRKVIVTSDVQPIVQPSKTVTYTENGSYEIEPDENWEYLQKANVNVEIPLEDSKHVTITENHAHVTISPSEGKTAIKEVTVDTEFTMEAEKSINITENGDYEVTPSQGYIGVERVNIHTEIIPTSQEKTLTVEDNGTYEIEPDEGNDYLDKVTVNVDLPIEGNKSVDINSNGTHEILPTGENLAMEKTTVHVDVHPVLEEKETIMRVNGATMTIVPSSDYEGLSGVVVTTDLPMQDDKVVNLTENNTSVEITPDEGYEGITKVTVTANLPMQNKRVTLTHLNDFIDVTPDQGYEGLRGVIASANIPVESKSVSITSNGTRTITPSQGNEAMTSVEVNVNVPIQDSVSETITQNGTTVITPSAGYDGMASAEITVDIPLEDKDVIINSGTTVITPSSGYEGLSQVTVTIPSMEGIALFAYDSDSERTFYVSRMINASGNYTIIADPETVGIQSFMQYEVTVDAEIHFNWRGTEQYLERNASKDILR